MKKHLHLLTAIFAVILSTTFAFGQTVESPQNRRQTIHFYNVEDRPPAPPFMTIIFNGIPEKEIDKVTKWREEIEQKLQELGGVRTEKDYEKISKVIPEYVQRFIGTGADLIAIEFPRARKGILLHRKK